MQHTRSFALLLGAAVTLTSAWGCELIAQVDRSQIPGAGGGGGVGGSGTTTSTGGSGGTGGATTSTGGSGGTGGTTTSTGGSGGTGGTTSSSSGGGSDGGVTCTTASDCPGADDDCQKRTCDNGACGTSFTDADTPVTAQTDGDCSQIVCDGNGGTKTIASDGDLPDDTNPCTEDLCDGGVPSHTSVDQGTICGTDLICDGNGTCVGCVTADDCPGADDECQTRTCDSGVCGFAFAPDGTELTTQSDGDCKKDVCDGAGKVKSIDDDADVPVDDKECTEDKCSSGTPENPAVASGTSCTENGGTVCDGNGACVECVDASSCPGQDTTCRTRTCLVGVCGFSNTADNTPCDDSNAQTKNDVCTAGVCGGVSLCTGVTCTAQDQCHDVGTCDPATGACSNPPKTDGATCDDNNAQTKNDVCTAGVCGGVGLCTGVTCTAQDQCHVAGTCDPSTGLCDNPAKANGTACDDGNAQTQNDVCTAGVCGGIDLCAGVTCTAQDQCHDVGTCDPATGQCDNPPKANASACNDGNACTQTDSCQNGTCVGTSPVTCTAQDECHAAGTCDPATGQCDNPQKPADTACTNGVCDASGACVQCNTAAQCPGSDTECQTRTCNAGTCGFAFAAANTLVSSQNPGDCQQNVCDGSGGVTSIADNTDAPTDDGNECTDDVCVAGAPSHPAKPDDTACSIGVCSAGICIACGDGITNGTEECDDGNNVNGDGCDNNCKLTACGNGIVTAGELCDDGNDDNGDGCDDNCTPTACGNGVVSAGELCDDGNADSTDGCTQDCVIGVVCDATAFPGGTRFAVDTATGNCYVSYDDVQTDFATAESACVAAGGQLATVTSASENAVVKSVQNTAQNPWIGATDDSNDTDAVFDWVTNEPWGFANWAAGQPDDDAGLGGNGECVHIVNAAGEWNDTDCNFVGFVTGRICEFQRCGNGIVEAGETCDDGGKAANDGCSATCTVETGWTCTGSPSVCTAKGVFFSEYVEGSSNNKAVEILNAGPVAVDLTGCSVRVYANGAATVSSTIALTGSLAAGSVRTVCHASASFAASCDVVAASTPTNTALNYNGDDAVELICGTTTLDVIGQIGFRPTGEWGTGLTSTADNTIRRKCSVTRGDGNGGDVFDPSVEWVGFAQDTFSGLGSASCAP